jgi:hypothetical protein
MIDGTYGHLIQGAEEAAAARLDALAARLGQERAPAEEAQHQLQDEKSPALAGLS